MKISLFDLYRGGQRGHGHPGGKKRPKIRNTFSQVNNKIDHPPIGIGLWAGVASGHLATPVTRKPLALDPSEM